MRRRDARLRGGAPGLLFLLLIVVILSPASPFPRMASASDLTLDIGVVVASNEGSTVDPALGGIRQKLQAMFKYSSYKLLGRERKALSIGKAGEFELPGRRVLKATPTSATGRKVRVDIQIHEGGKNLLTTTVGLSRGAMVIVGGPSHQNGVLILLISAE